MFKDKAHLVLSKAKDKSIELVRFLYCDNSGIIRGKCVPVEKLKSRIESGIGITIAMPAINMFDQVVPVKGYDPVGEVRLIPDLDTFTVLPYDKGVALMMADMYNLETKTPDPICSRSFLKRMIEKAEKMGIIFQVSFECEFVLFKTDANGKDVPLDSGQCFSTKSMMPATEVIKDIMKALKAQNIEPELYYSECCYGQHEIPIKYSNPLRAADNQIIYRETVRNIAYRHGLKVSFAPKPVPEQAGTGCHIHFSLLNKDSSENLTYNPNDEYKISKTAYHFIAGILRHTPGLLAMTAPSYNSYKRLKPSCWASAYTCWGPDNREATVRAVSGLWRNEAKSFNLEYKPCDMSINPYIALGGIIAAGLDGIEKEQLPGDPALVNPAGLSDEDRKKLNMRRYPESLDKAIENMRNDKVLMQAIGEVLGTVYLAVRKSEFDAFVNKDAEFEMKHFMYNY